MCTISSYCGTRPTNTHTHKTQTNKQTHRQDRLQYTAPQLASTQCNQLTYKLTLCNQYFGTVIPALTSLLAVTIVNALLLLIKQTDLWKDLLPKLTSVVGPSPSPFSSSPAKLTQIWARTSVWWVLMIFLVYCIVSSFNCAIVLSPALHNIFHTPMARYSMFVLQMPLNTN